MFWIRAWLAPVRSTPTIAKTKTTAAADRGTTRPIDFASGERCAPMRFRPERTEITVAPGTPTKNRRVVCTRTRCAYATRCLPTCPCLVFIVTPSTSDLRRVIVAGVVPPDRVFISVRFRDLLRFESIHKHVPGTRARCCVISDFKTRFRTDRVVRRDNNDNNNTTAVRPRRGWHPFACSRRPSSVGGVTCHGDEFKASLGRGDLASRQSCSKAAPLAITGSRAVPKKGDGIILLRAPFWKISRGGPRMIGALPHVTH